MVKSGAKKANDRVVPDMIMEEVDSKGFKVSPILRWTVYQSFILYVPPVPCYFVPWRLGLQGVPGLPQCL